MIDEPPLLALVLPGPDPASWLRDHLADRFERDESNTEPRRLVTPTDLLTDDAALLRQLHRVLLAQDVPPGPAAMYLAGWFAGGLAGCVGYGLATAGTGFVVGPEGVRWHLHPDGWCERIDLDPVRTNVLASHPWAALPGVQLADDAATVVAQAVRAAVETATPIVEACRDLAPVGRVGLWNEVGDALGTALAYQLDLRVTPAMAAVLAAAVRVPGMPWRAKPALRFTDASIGRVHVVQKGGCCLAYTEPHAESDYCSTCSFREPGDCDALQVAWMEEQHRERTGAPT